MFNKKIRLHHCFLMLIAWFIVSPYASAQITASGCSVSTVGYLSDLAKEYEKQTGIKVLVRGGGSVVGLEDLHAGRVDFAASCREKSEGDPDNLEFAQVAWDVLVPIVHPSNLVKDIAPDDIRNIFFAVTTNWKQLKGRDEPIKLFLARPAKGLSGVESSTRALILQGKEPVVTVNVTRHVSSGVVEQMVEKTPEGFAVSGYSSARKRMVKMLQVGGVSPTQKTIANNTYPFKRPLFLIITKDTKPEVRRFVAFALSREGQKLISSFGVVPVKGEK